MQYLIVFSHFQADFKTTRENVSEKRSSCHWRFIMWLEGLRSMASSSSMFLGSGPTLLMNHAALFSYQKTDSPPPNNQKGWLKRLCPDSQNRTDDLFQCPPPLQEWLKTEVDTTLMLLFQFPFLLKFYQFTY